MDFEKRLSELFIELPEIPEPKQGSLPVVLSGKLAFVGQQAPFSEGRLTFKGRLGFEVNLDQGVLAARHAVIQTLAVLRGAIGSLNRVKQVVQVSVLIASAPDFKDHEKVIEGALSLLRDIFGPAGKAVCQAGGVQSLPQGVCLVLSLLFELK